MGEKAVRTTLPKFNFSEPGSMYYKSNEIEQCYPDITVNHIFSGKAISKTLCCYLLVDTALQMTLISYLLPETTAGIDEKVTEETIDQNVSNVKF